MKVIGVDPGLAATGLGIIKGGREFIFLEGKVIYTSSSLELPKRIAKVYWTFQEKIQEAEPDVVVLEELFVHKLHPLTSVMMAHIRGVICLVAELNSLPVVSLLPTHWKGLLTGNGQASKHQVKKMIAKLLGIDAEKLATHIIDALGLALAYSLSKELC